MTKKQVNLVEKVAQGSNDDPKKLFQNLGKLPSSVWKGLRVHIEKGFLKGKKTDSWFSETMIFRPS